MLRKILLWILILNLGSVYAAEKQVVIIKEPQPAPQVHARKDGSYAVYQFDGKGQWNTTVIPQPKRKPK